ncbi:hypothetical protein [Amnibacterium kyonggiense]
MRDGDGEGPSGSTAPSAPATVDDGSLDTPNCPDCLTRMEPEESPSGEPYWACTECGFIALA